MMAALLFCISSFIFKSTKSFRTARRYSKYKLEQPKIPHLILNENDINNRAIFIIGDVHGCLDELKELLRLAKLEAKTRQILPIFVGDLANKGPHNAETVREIRTMDSYAVRGNHDEAVIKQYLNKRHDPDYILTERYKWVKELDQQDIEYLQELPYTIHIPSKKIIIVHAGIVPGIPIDEQDFTNFITMRNLYKEDSKLVASESRLKGDPWASIWPGPEHVYFGHDAVRKLQQYEFATGLDTGCLYGFKITGIFIDNNKIIQVNAKKVYREP